MGLFDRKKKDDVTPESLGFGFPATEKRREVEGITPMAPPAPGEAPAPKAPAPAAQQAPIMPAPEPIQAKPAQPLPMPAPEPIAEAPAKAFPALEARPMVPVTMPEDIQAPRAPTIQKLRPHVFLKISKYKEVMSSIDSVMNHIKDLKKSLGNVRDIEEKESIKIKESESVLAKLEEVASVFDKIFSNPEK